MGNQRGSRVTNENQWEPSGTKGDHRDSSGTKDHQGAPCYIGLITCKYFGLQIKAVFFIIMFVGIFLHNRPKDHKGPLG